MNEYQRADSLRRRLPEMLELEELRLQCRGVGEVTVEDEVQHMDHVFPIYSFAFGADGPTVPRVAFVGGVHGLERVGTNLAISFLKTVLELIQWDKGLQHLLSKCRLVILPMANPGGMFARTRANPNGIDLMRNAPIDADVKPNIALIGGHRISPRLPWYRGLAGAPLERETEALARFVRRELYPAPFSIALDLHSGFGLVDRLWFPFANSRKPFDHLEMMYALKVRLDRSLPNHFYQMEPQSLQYVTHGDIWDWLFLELKGKNPGRVMLPLTLEMGSWIWIKKNPRQAFTALGIFNPLLPHRLQRTLRRHLALLDFLLRAAASHDNWSAAGKLMDERCGPKALELWYTAQLARRSA
jgi:hypothetical protein